MNQCAYENELMFNYDEALCEIVKKKLINLIL